jgi:hypothetical protein
LALVIPDGCRHPGRVCATIAAQGNSDLLPEPAVAKIWPPGIGWIQHQTYILYFNGLPDGLTPIQEDHISVKRHDLH